MTRLCGRALTFGDDEQIQALQDMEAEKLLEEENERLGLKAYSVSVEVVAEYTETVMATNKEDAEAKAAEEVETCMLDFDVNVYAREKK